MPRTTPSLDYWANDVLAVDKPLPRQDPARKSFWHKAVPEMDATGKVIRGGMWEHQRKWWELPSFVKALVGGYGSGKTYIGAKRVIALALQNAPCMVAAVSPTFPLARKTIIPTIIALLAGKKTHYGRQFWWRYNKSTHEFRFRYKGRDALIQVMSGEDPDSLRGPNLGAAWLDEPFLMDPEVFTQMIARVRHPDATAKEVDLTGTPEQLNWGYDLLLGELKSQYEKAGTTIGFIQASSRQNLATGADYIKRLEGAFTEKMAEAFIEGGFVNLSSGQVYYGFHNTGLDTNLVDMPIPDNAELGCGMDFNVNPMAAALFWRAGNHVHFFDEIELPNADTEYLCSVLREKYVDNGPRKVTKQELLYIYPDATGNARKTASPQGRTDFHYIRAAGFEIKAHSENPKQRDRHNAVNAKFRPKIGKPSLTVGPNCKKLTRYLLTHTHELAHKQKAMTHLLDAFGYPVEYLYPVAAETLRQYNLTGT